MEMRKVHLVGIGGSGLSAIAVLLLERGVQVSGSDRQLSPLARRVQVAGGQVYLGHNAENIAGADLVVQSSAIPDDNVEVLAARRLGVPVYRRVDFLGLLTSGYRTIAVAGTHGKTTTTAMIAWLLASLGFDPSYIIGGLSINLGGNAHHGLGDIFVIEADEYDGMFLGLNPEIAVVTNIEHDHPDCYPTGEAFYQAFAAFSQRILPGGALLVCKDDTGATRLMREAAGGSFRVLAYGNQELECDYLASDLQETPAAGIAFHAVSLAGAGQQVDLTLQLPGRHNALNALAALSVADLLGIEWQRAAAPLAAFQGTGRRFELRGTVRGVTVIDDYAHHPTEIRATLAAARGRFPGEVIWAVWQPHTYSRTRLLTGQFATAFADADHVLVLQIYAARETAPADGFSAQSVLAEMNHPDARYIPGIPQAQEYLLAHLQPGSIVLVLSAGDADQLSGSLIGALENSGPYLPVPPRFD